MEEISVKQAFRDLESLLFARKELRKESGVSIGELDALIADKAEILVRVFNKALSEKPDKNEFVHFKSSFL